jgi:hypothetical protein
MGVFMEEFLTVKEVSQRTKFAEQTLHSLINKGFLVQGEHYFKLRLTISIPRGTHYPDEPFFIVISMWAG